MWQSRINRDQPQAVLQVSRSTESLQAALQAAARQHRQRPASHHTPQCQPQQLVSCSSWHFQSSSRDCCHCRHDRLGQAAQAAAASRTHACTQRQARMQEPHATLQMPVPQGAHACTHARSWSGTLAHHWQLSVAVAVQSMLASSAGTHAYSQWQSCSSSREDASAGWHAGRHQLACMAAQQHCWGHTDRQARVPPKAQAVKRSLLPPSRRVKAGKGAYMPGGFSHCVTWVTGL